MLTTTWLEGVVAEVKNPLPNFHAARIRNPDDFARIVVLQRLPNGVLVYGGPLKSAPNAGTKTQSVRFPIESFTIAQARKWLTDHNYKPIAIEPATPKEKAGMRIIQASEIEAEIFLDGTVGEEIDGELVAAQIRRLNDQGVKTIKQHINSGGGSVVNGFAIVSANLASEATIEIHNDGLAGSMAGIILLTGDKVFMRDYATLMLHEPSLGSETIDKTQDEKVKTGLLAIRDSLSKIVQRRSGKTKAEVDQILKDETWYSAAQAKAAGFIDTIIKTERKPGNVVELKAGIQKQGDEWEITLITSGTAHAKTGSVHMPKDVLKKSTGLFEGVAVFAHQYGTNGDGSPSFDHRPDGQQNPDLFILNKVGWVTDVRYIDNGAKAYLVGRLHCVNKTMRDLLVNTWEKDKSRMPEFSVDARVAGPLRGNVRHITEIGEVASLDVVDRGAFFGSGFNRLVASKQGDNMDKLIQAILAAVKAGKMTLTGVESEGKTDEEISSSIKGVLGVTDKAPDLTDEQINQVLSKSGIDEIKAAIAEMQKADDGDDDDKGEEDKPAPAPEGETADEKVKRIQDKLTQMEKDVELQASINVLNEKLAAAKLPEFPAKRVSTLFAGRVAKPEEIDSAIKAEKEYMDRLVASAPTAKLQHSVVVGVNSQDRKVAALEMLIDPNLKIEDQPANMQDAYRLSASEHFVSLHDALLAFAGARRYEGMATLKAAATTDFPTLFQDAMNKSIRKQYQLALVDDRVSKLIDEGSAETLDEQHVYDVGAFGDIDVVTEGGTYTELATPGDVEATYSLEKFGNLFTLTEETFFTSGDKVTRLIQLFPRKMANAAKATRNKYILDRITGCNGSTVNARTIYTGGVLYTDAQLNITRDALDYDSFYAGYVAMLNQTQLSTSVPAEIKPKYLLVPHELMVDAVNITQNPVYPSQTSNGVPLKNTYSGLGVEPISVPNYYLCGDINNWYIVADKGGFPTFELKYFRNQRVPQIFLQNAPTVGTPFTSDEWRYKVKWRFGGAITDYRTFFGGITADA